MTPFAAFSKKQLTAMSWWCPGSPYHSRDAIICDGAVRSGKTLSMSLGFLIWAMSSFSDADFALCGKTVTALRRNLVTPLLAHAAALGFSCTDKVSRGIVTVTRGRTTNRFYLFGGRDEGSAALIQGVTLAGVLFDETALMPRSFVEQAIARCSVSGSRFWFNCNPEHPFHWFYRGWILQANKKNACYLHFTMEDNPSLTPEIKARYRSLYEGSFYRRFILGEWTAAAGAVYPMFDPRRHVTDDLPAHCSRYVISCDYGTLNPTSMGLWGALGDGRWLRLREYYHDARQTGRQLTDEEYYLALERLAGGCEIEAVVVDPSAASFLTAIRRHGRFRVIPAKNDVTDGIRRVSDALRAGRLCFHSGCTDILREFGQYVWDEKAGCDKPKKQNDHAMDDLRYFVSTILTPEEPFFVGTVARR